MSAEVVPIDVLRQLLRYEPETGRLFWLSRTPELAAWSGRRFPTRTARAFNANFAGKEALTAVGKNGYRVGSIFEIDAYAHRVAWALVHGAWPAGQIDHVNGDRADNRLSNLRIATQRQNNANARKRAGTTSRFKGVSWSKAVRKWGVQFRAEDGKLRTEWHLDEVSAARAYDRLARHHFGEFARLNFPDEGASL